MRLRATVVLLLCLLMIAGNSLLWASGPTSKRVAQQGNDAQFGQRGQEQVKPDPEIEKKMAKSRLQDRYKGLKHDSEKLLELATELKQYVDKSNENVLSMDVVKKCEEIERLAKSVRGKMKGD